jgi:hypothetical protein
MEEERKIKKTKLEEDEKFKFTVKNIVDYQSSLPSIIKYVLMVNDEELSKIESFFGHCFIDEEDEKNTPLYLFGTELFDEIYDIITILFKSRNKDAYKIRMVKEFKSFDEYWKRIKNITFITEDDSSLIFPTIKWI